MLPFLKEKKKKKVYLENICFSSKNKLCDINNDIFISVFDHNIFFSHFYCSRVAYCQENFYMFFSFTGDKWARGKNVVYRIMVLLGHFIIDPIIQRITIQVEKITSGWMLVWI